MKTLKLALLISLFSFGAQAQLNTLTKTTLSAASGARDTTFSLASVTNVNAPTGSTPASMLYIVDPGESIGQLVQVAAVNGLQVKVVPRGSGANGNAHKSGAMVLVAAQPNWFYNYNPTGPCVTASTTVTPVVNTNTGQQWLCSATTGTWVPGWGTASSQTAQLLSSTATASVGGATAIAGPLVEISGTEAITSFTMSTGWNGQGFCVYPTAAFTIVAGNNISEASTADANQIMCFFYNARTAAFSPSY